MCEQSALAVVQDVRGLAGDLVYDCRPPLLPVSIPLRDVCCSSIDRPTAPSSLVVAPVEVISGSVRERVANPGVRGDAIRCPRDRRGGRVGIRLPVTDDDFTASGLGRRNMYPARYLEPPPPALASSPTPPPAKYCIAGACVVRPGGFTSHGGNGPDPCRRSGFSYG